MYNGFRYFLVVLSSVLMGLSQHPIGLGFLSYIALIPILSLLLKTYSYKDAIIQGFLWGIIYNLVAVYWIASNIGTSSLIAFFTMILSVLILTSGPIFIFLIWCVLNKRGNSIYTLSFIWPIIEIFRSYGSLAFPWISLANSQLDYHLIIQNAEYVGMYGITFWIVFLNIVLFKLIADRTNSILIFAIVIFSIPFISGKIIISSYDRSSNESLRILSVQPNIHLSEKRSQDSQGKIISKIIYQSSSSIDDDIDLVVWPETSTISYILQNDKSGYKQIKDMLKDKKTHLIAGIPYYNYIDRELNYYNSTAYFNSSGAVGLYHKINLVPGAEYVPLSKYINSLDIFNFGQGNFAHGDEFTLFTISDYKFSSMICFESTFPRLSREFVKEGANFLVYVVNDGWYETPPEPQQHASRVIYRAIETRRPVIRCANTGISMVVDELGNIQHQLDLNKEGNIIANIYPSDRLTFYVRYGDIFIYIMIIIVILCMFKPLRYEKFV